MGKSAKLHKRLTKKLKSSIHSANQSSTSTTSSQGQAQTAKKRSNLKDKSGKNKGSKSEDGLLGGADYLTLLTGSRKKIAEEAKKLPRDD